jgi:Kef-type K+ transport system membrane component KefB
MLLALGIIISEVSRYIGVEMVDLMPYLEVLGIVGLILIVLEAALDLKVQKSKRKLVSKSFLLALGSLLINALLVSSVILVYLDLNFFNSLIYAIPLSIASSAIIIPSLTNLPEEKREFLTYESAFSDILGIIFFYFLIQTAHMSGATEIGVALLGNITFTILISFVFSLALVYLFQKATGEARLFLLIAVLILLYSIGKLFHLSSLIMILIFGLILENRRLITGKYLGRYFKEETISVIHKDLRMITIESSFTVRTFFFVIFGMTIVLASLTDIKVIVVSLIILALLFGVRYLIFKLFFKSDIFPEVYISPRGLITLLLFYSIPEEYISDKFNPAVLLFVIIISSLVMAWSLIKYSRTTKVEAVQSIAETDVDSGQPEEKPDSVDSDNTELDLPL